MSDNKMPADAMVELTVEELQNMKRAAFVDGIAYSTEVGRCRNPEGPHGCEWCEAEARRCYPIRRKVPRRVPLFFTSNARVSAMIDEMGRLRFVLGDTNLKLEGYAGFPPHLSTEATESLRDLLNNPVEEVDE